MSCYQVAKDASTVRPDHSPFTAALLQTLTRPDLTLNDVIPEITKFVMDDTKEKQIPGMTTSGFKPAGARTVLFPTGN